MHHELIVAVRCCSFMCLHMYDSVNLLSYLHNYDDLEVSLLQIFRLLHSNDTQILSSLLHLLLLFTSCTALQRVVSQLIIEDKCFTIILQLVFHKQTNIATLAVRLLKDICNTVLLSSVLNNSSNHESSPTSSPLASAMVNISATLTGTRLSATHVAQFRQFLLSIDTLKPLSLFLSLHSFQAAAMADAQQSQYVSNVANALALASNSLTHLSQTFPANTLSTVAVTSNITFLTDLVRLFCTCLTDNEFKIKTESILKIEDIVSLISFQLRAQQMEM